MSPAANDNAGAGGPPAPADPAALPGRALVELAGVVEVADAFGVPGAGAVARQLRGLDAAAVPALPPAPAARLLSDLASGLDALTRAPATA